MSQYILNGLIKRLPPNPKSTIGITLFKKFLKVDLDELNVPYADSCCLEGETIFPVRNNEGVLETLDDTGAWVTFSPDITLEDIIADSVATDNITESTADAGVTIDGLTVENGGITANSMIAGFYPQGATDNIAAAAGGAISVTNYFTTINTDGGGDAFTLANGTQIGQLKLIRLVVDGGGDGTVTPTSLSGGTTITFNDAGDEAELQWNGTAWVVIKNLGVTVA